MRCASWRACRLGDAVTRFRKGDRVAPTFFPDWLGGPLEAALLERNLGNTVPGTASEYMVVGEQALVHAPATLGDLEVATLPCAAVTAWGSLFSVRATRARAVRGRAYGVPGAPGLPRSPDRRS